LRSVLSRKMRAKAIESTKPAPAGSPTRATI
jgi:hypothetical protein